MRSTFILMSLLAIFGMLGALGCGRRDDSAGGGRRTVIQNKGSDTLVNVAQAWAENYKSVAPDVAIAVSGGGSGTGISALINGTVDLANASRKMKEKEVAMATQNNVTPVEFIVGYDALAVFLHSDNPLETVTLSQLAEIYGEGGQIKKWSQLGVQVPGCKSDEIIRVSRQNNSGTFVYFKRAVLGKKRDYELGSRDMHGSKDVVDLVQHTPCAIGYSGLAYATPELAMACVVPNEGDSCILPTRETAADRSYPISRPLIMYTAGQPSGPLKTYLDWILSAEGQCIIQEKGYAPTGPVTCG